ncbi:hypothetical protein HNR26_002975 [Rhizobium rosettiformans]|uniref:PRTase-CE domain-containing protein n=2 Tax=Rhizobium rosettiformans TaxID=1368430 RepID=A0A4S8PTH2_9HYPH|nr:hypothetical protein [Rhizobium rosettiformans]MBB5276897.1 hypothetical protein [Rhizobium rosettiformans]THV34713.1 hypothetical protein FAA86_13575 [Rhizobium rosettiformans W3]
MTKLSEIPVAWDAGGDRNILEPGTVSYVRFLGQKLFDDYEPLQFHSFDAQLLDWLNNVEDEDDRKLLFALLGDIFYVGRKEYAALYRSAYSGIISSWIVDVCSLSLFSPDIDEQIRTRVNESWVCPMTDSLRINAFLKTNNLISQSLRPDWHSLKELGDLDKIRTYLAKAHIRNLIILEDFVGTGNQASGVLTFLGSNFPELNVLLCPLIVCPKGDERLHSIAGRFPNVTYAPQLVLPQSSIFTEVGVQGEPTHHAGARTLFDKISARFDLPSHETMYGFKSTGSQVVMHSNCPNNTLQVFHHSSDKWEPLFPRVRRVL